jgi:PAS fold
VNSSTYVKQPCTRSSLTRIVSGSSTPAADYDDGALGPRRRQSAVATGQLSEDEARFRRAADGRYRWFLVRGLPLRDQHGKIVRWYGTLTDIEDRKRAGDHPRDTRIRLTRAWQIATVAEPSASIAHELNRSTSPSYV